MGCSGINGKICKSNFVENKRHNLCPDCNFLRVHGITRQEYNQQKKKDKFLTSHGLDKKVGMCSKCGNEPIVNHTHKLGYNCNRERMLARKEYLGIEEKPKKKVGLKTQKKQTGELEIYKEIWNERPHKSEIDGTYLGEELQPIFFSHILSKGAYPSYRLDKRNIILKTPEQHQLWEFGDKKELRKDPNWNIVFERFDELKFEYYEW